MRDDFIMFFLLIIGIFFCFFVFYGLGNLEAREGSNICKEEYGGNYILERYENNAVLCKNPIDGDLRVVDLVGR